ncbi:hypothetical protein UT300007_03720 [Clostridium sp. CTA-7]
MFISIPKEFFVPVLFSEEFRYNFESNTMEYDTEETTNEEEIFKNSRKRLADIDYIADKKDTEETEEIVEDNLKNIENEIIEDFILRYIKEFMRYTEELKEYRAFDSNEEEIINQLNFHVKKFRNIYNEYINLIYNTRKPLSKPDIERIINHYVGEIHGVYDKHLNSLDCKKIDCEHIENKAEEVVNDTKDVLEHYMRKLNYSNNDDECKKHKDVEEEFKYSDNVFNIADDEFIKGMKREEVIDWGIKI